MNGESLHLEQIKGGAAIEMVNNALQEVYDDIADPNKQGNAQRKVNLEIIFAPTEDATAGLCKVSVKSTLGKQKDLGTTVFFGRVDGQGVCTERNMNQPMFGVMETSGHQ